MIKGSRRKALQARGSPRDVPTISTRPRPTGPGLHCIRRQRGQGVTTRASTGVQNEGESTFPDPAGAGRPAQATLPRRTSNRLHGQRAHANQRRISSGGPGAEGGHELVARHDPVLQRQQTEQQVARRVLASEHLMGSRPQWRASDLGARPPLRRSSRNKLMIMINSPSSQGGVN